MNPSRGKQLLIATFIIVVAVITWNEIHVQKNVPRPARYVFAGITYGILGVAAPFISYELAGLFGVGLMLTLLYQNYQSQKAAVTPPNEGPGIGAGLADRMGRGTGINN